MTRTPGPLTPHSQRSPLCSGLPFAVTSLPRSSSAPRTCPPSPLPQPDSRFATLPRTLTLAAAATLLLAAALAPPLLAAQSPAPGPPAPQPAVATSAAAPAPLTPAIQPATTELAQILPTLHPDKWKLSPELRRRNEENLASISGDLSSTLPNLLSAADAAPGQLPPMLAVSRNLHALYDVVLRVLATAEIAAPEQQTTTLTHALTSLSSARQTLDGQLDTSALAQQQQLATLQTSLATANTSLASTKAALQQAQSTNRSTSTTKPHPKTHHKPPSPTTSTTPPQ